MNEQPGQVQVAQAEEQNIHGSVKLVVDGLPTLDLIYDANDIADAEELAGINMLSAMGHQSGGMTVKEMRGLLFALSRKNHPKLTLQQIGRYVRTDTLTMIYDACWETCVRGAGDEFARANLKLIEDFKAAQARALEAAAVQLIEMTKPALPVESTEGIQAEETQADEAEQGMKIVA